MLGVKTFEYAEDPLCVHRIKTNPVVGNCKKPLGSGPRGRYFNQGSHIRSAVFQCVTEQILKQLKQMSSFHSHEG